MIYHKFKLIKCGIILKIQIIMKKDHRYSQSSDEDQSEEEEYGKTKSKGKGSKPGPKPQEPKWTRVV